MATTDSTSISDLDSNAEDSNIFESKMKALADQPVYEEEDSGRASLPYDTDGDMGYEPVQDDSILGYGFEAPPILDPFAEDNGSDIYNRPAIDCPYDAPPVDEPDPAEDENPFEIAPDPGPADYPDASAAISDENRVGPVASDSETTTAAVSTAMSTSNDASEEDDDDEPPPPPPAADYDDNGDPASAERTEEDVRLSAEASEQLQAAMGIEIAKKSSKKGKKKKSRHRSDKSEDDLVVSKSKTKRKSSGVNQQPSSPVSLDAFEAAPLPVDPSAATINDMDATTDAGHESVSADLNSPNDVLLYHRGSLGSINGALGSSGRVRYTCISVSESYVALGCNTGGVFCFERASSRFLQVLPRRDGEVTTVKFGHDEDLLAMGTEEGIVSIWRGPWGSTTKTATLLKAIVEHGSVGITALSWSFDSKHLFSGDTAGVVYCTKVTKKPYIPSTTKFVSGMKMFHKAVAQVVPDAEVVFRCQSRIVQLDTAALGTVLISTLTHAIIASPFSRQVWKVGSKPRDGEFGACFGPGTKFPATFCARPGGRIWVAKSRTGTVSATFNLKNQLDREPSPLMSECNAPCNSGAETPLPDFNFRQLLVVREQYLVSWSSSSILVVDPAKARLLGWYNGMTGIVDVAVMNDEIYVLHTNKEELDKARNTEEASPLEFKCQRLSLLSPGECASIMASNGEVLDAIEMILEYFDNAPFPKFLDNVSQSDLTLLRHLASERLKKLTTATPGKDSEALVQQKQLAEELETRLTDVALKAAESRMISENETVAFAEAAFVNRINQKHDALQMEEIVVEAHSDVDGRSSDSDGERYASHGNIFTELAKVIKQASPKRLSSST